VYSSASFSLLPPHPPNQAVLASTWNPWPPACRARRKLPPRRKDHTRTIQWRSRRGHNRRFARAFTRFKQCTLANKCVRRAKGQLVGASRVSPERRKRSSEQRAAQARAAHKPRGPYPGLRTRLTMSFPRMRATRLACAPRLLPLSSRVPGWRRDAVTSGAQAPALRPPPVRSRLAAISPRLFGAPGRASPGKASGWAIRTARSIWMDKLPPPLAPSVGLPLSGLRAYGDKRLCVLARSWRVDDLSGREVIRKGEGGLGSL
jgi:hypothetical protein